MTYKFNGKNLRIPDEDIQRTMKSYSLSKEEAIKIWLEDEGYLENEEQEALEKKAKETRITATIHQASAKDKVVKKTQKERCHKENPTKEALITAIASFLPRFNFPGEEKVINVQILNPGKLISFSIGGENYEIDLKQKRKPKNSGEK